MLDYSNDYLISKSCRSVSVSLRSSLHANILALVSPFHRIFLTFDTVNITVTGARCETKIPTECSCPPDHQCVLENNISFTYKCVTPPVVATSCDKNATCPPPSFGSARFTISLEQMIGIISALIFIVFLICSIIICRYVEDIFLNFFSDLI